MLFPFYALFFFTLITGSIIAINSSSWFIAWVGLEMNLLSILPILAIEKSKGSSESCVKYFLIQSMASLLILISSVYVFTPFLFNSIWLIFIGLSVKLGAVPFHFWFPSVMEGVGWMSCVLLMTWQKLAPLFLMSFVNMFLLVIIFTSLVGALGGFGQFSIKKILAFSSINHVGWMLAAMLMGVKISIVYFLIYFIISFLIVVSFYSFKLYYINQIGVASYFLKIVILANFMSLGGLPPLLGFFPKWFVIEKLLCTSFFLSLILIFSSLISLYFYLRITYPLLFFKFLSSEGILGVTICSTGILSSFFLSSGGVFLYPLLSFI